MVDYQSSKFAHANALKRKIMESDVRQKVKALSYNVAFLDRMLDAVFVNPPASALANNTSLELMPEEERKELQAQAQAANVDLAFAHELSRRIDQMDRQLENMRKQQLDEQLAR